MIDTIPINTITTRIRHTLGSLLLNIQEIPEFHSDIVSGQGIEQDVGIGMRIEAGKASSDLGCVGSFGGETHCECGAVEAANGVYV
jgi:hypothetical protein